MCIRFLNIQVPENIIEYQMMPLKSYFFLWIFKHNFWCQRALFGRIEFLMENDYSTDKKLQICKIMVK